MSAEDTVVVEAGFQRDRLTYLNYAIVGVFVYLAVIIGPILPSFRSYFGLSYTAAGLVQATFAAGVGIAGLCADRIMRRRGVARTCWISALVFGLSAAALGLLPSVATLYMSFFVAGVAGGVMLSLAASVLSAHHGKYQTTAVVEANVVAGAASLSSPVIVALFQRAGLGWRPTLFVPLAAVAMVFFFFRKERFDISRTDSPEHVTRGRLGRDYWYCWVLLMIVVALETGLNMWGAQYFQSVVGLAHSTALLAPIFFYCAFLSSRILGAYLSRKRSETLLLRLALVTTLGGVVLYWIWPSAVPAMFGYAVAGFGVANLWPLTLSLGIHRGKRRGLGDVAAARASSASGLSSLTIPPILGAVADGFGLHTSQALIGMLAAGGLLLLAKIVR